MERKTRTYNRAENGRFVTSDADANFDENDNPDGAGTDLTEVENLVKEIDSEISEKTSGAPLWLKIALIVAAAFILKKMFS